jgi:hypothetical protein
MGSDAGAAAGVAAPALSEVEVSHAASRAGARDAPVRVTESPLPGDGERVRERGLSRVMAQEKDPSP